MTKFSCISVLSLLIFLSCKEVKNETKSKAQKEAVQISTAGTTYKIDAKNSVITWKGFAVVDGHNGTISISEGVVNFEKGHLKAGNFIIDMGTIAVLDLEDEEENGDLVGHLKSEDFFDVEKFPTSEFVLTDIEEKENKTFLRGNFTLKGTIRNIEFPVVVSKQGKEVTMVSKPFTIDRTEWGIIYDSGKFFKDLKDELIKDEIEITINLKGFLDDK
ncbi:YceI family protein [Spongiimicrobium sp. 3-5]|uniref:YceI family protein n=1 Tax=Spongiimicrobium sp. 3-5 TaxID=3332596 RepID=UPI00398122DD